jgi:hypothetical protein
MLTARQPINRSSRWTPNVSWVALQGVTPFCDVAQALFPRIPLESRSTVQPSSATFLIRGFRSWMGVRRESRARPIL